MKLSLSTASLYLYPLSLTFRVAREVGFEGVELVLNAEVLASGTERVNRLAAEHGLDVYSVHPPLRPVFGIRNVAKGLPGLARVARDLGCSLVVVHAPGAETPESESWDSYVTSVEEASTILRGSQTRIALENQVQASDGRTFVLSDLRDARAFADEHDLALVLDTTHAVGSGYTLLEAYDIFAGRLQNVHLSDWRMPPGPLAHPLFDNLFKQHQMPGTGIVPLHEFIARLGQDGYKGCITLEVTPYALQAWSSQRAKSNLRRGASFVRQHWAAGSSQT